MRFTKQGRTAKETVHQTLGFLIESMSQTNNNNYNNTTITIIIMTNNEMLLTTSGIKLVLLPFFTRLSGRRRCKGCHVRRVVQSDTLSSNHFRLSQIIYGEN